MGYKRKLFNLLPKKLKIDIEDKIRRKKSLREYNPDQIKNPIFQSSIAALDYYQCIFVHIPKNAGLSISYTLFGNTGGSHRKITDYKKLFSERTFKKYYKFTFVRNPWDRLVSTYFFLKKGGLTNKDKIWAKENLETFNDFEVFVKQWLTEDNIKDSLHFQQQYKFLMNAEKKIEVDFIGRFENIEEDFKTITNHLEIKRSLQKTNSSNRDLNYRTYFTKETQAIVESVYKKDIKLFKYSF